MGTPDRSSCSRRSNRAHRRQEQAPLSTRCDSLDSSERQKRRKIGPREASSVARTYSLHQRYFILPLSVELNKALLSNPERPLLQLPLTRCIRDFAQKPCACFSVVSHRRYIASGDIFEVFSTRTARSQWKLDFLRPQNFGSQADWQYSTPWGRTPASKVRDDVGMTGRTEYTCSKMSLAQVQAPESYPYS